MRVAATAEIDLQTGALTSGRIDDIECLRAFAILGVLFHHMQGVLYYWSPAWMSQIFEYFAFWPGVDLFFAVSGFVIARSLLPELAGCAGNRAASRNVLLAFWIGRAFRLLPSAWLWLGLILFAVWGFNDSGAFGSLRANLWATLMGIANLANFRFADSFMQYEYGASFAYWSLSLEEQFYLLFPLLAWALRAYRLAWLLAILILVQAILPRSVLGFVLRTDALAWGVLVAIACHSRFWKQLQPWGLRSRWLRYPVLLSLVGSIAGLAAWNDPGSLNWRVAAIAVLAGTLVWIASYAQGYICADGWLKRPLIWTGSRSYAIYLIHIPAYYFVRECFWRLGMAGDSPPPYSSFIYCASAMLLIGLLAEANFRWIEIPLRERGRRLARRFQHRDSNDSLLAPPSSPIPVNPPCQN